jgi:DNA-binding NtrC family response regulator
MARVMILEDDQNLRRFLSILVQSKGHEVVFEGGSGHVGILYLARYPDATDVILTDMRMPIADGLDVLASTRTLASRRIPVIMTSAHWTQEEVALVRDLGAFAVFSKPFDLERLSRAIDRATSRAHQPS